MSTKEPVRLPDGAVENFMIKLAGKSFICSCGCNVFHKPDNTNLGLYQCNACETQYESD